MFAVDKCCCGCTLGDGTVAAGIVATVEAVLYLAFGVYLLYQHIPYPPLKNFYIENFSLGTAIWFIVHGTLLVCCCCFLFRAVKLRTRLFLLPWLILRGITIVSNIFITTAMFASGQTVSYAVKTVALLMVAKMVYLYVVVLSFYQSLKMHHTNSSRILVSPQDVLGPFSPYQDHVKESQVPSAIVNVEPRKDSFPQPRHVSSYLPQQLHRCPTPKCSTTTKTKTTTPYSTEHLR